jgi:hypothetical protein
MPEAGEAEAEHVSGEGTSAFQSKFEGPVLLAS